MSDNFNDDSAADPGSELTDTSWAVITDREVPANNLIYDDALITAEKLQSENVAGVCVVTAETAARVEN